MTTEVTRKIHVYQDSPVWDKYDRWFKVPLPMLDSLYVATYELTGDDVWECDVEALAAPIREQYPNHILIY
jgi:hypothetical protein